MEVSMKTIQVTAQRAAIHHQKLQQLQIIPPAFGIFVCCHVLELPAFAFQKKVLNMMRIMMPLG